MCELSTILMIGSTLLGAAGTIQQGAAAQEAANYNAQVQEMNAQLADRRAKDALERGAQDEQRKRIEVQQVAGRQRAAMAANGMDISFGSALDTLVDTATRGELDALTIRSNTAREAYDMKVDASNRRAGAELSRMEGRSAMTGALLSAGGTLLTGAGKAYSQYKQSKIGGLY